MQTVSLDLETHLIKAGCTAPKLVCMTTDGPDGQQIYLREDALERAREIIKEDNVVTQHGFFDMCVLAAEDESFIPLIYKMIWEGRFHCTKIRQMIIDNAEGRLKFTWDEESNEFKRQNYRLETLVLRHLGEDIEASKKGADIWRLRYNELDGVPLEEWPDDAIAYAIGDAVRTLKIFESQDRYTGGALPGDDVEDVVSGEVSQNRAAWALYLCGTWGCRTDAKMVAAQKEELGKEYNEWKKVAQKWKFIRTGKKESKDTKKIKAAVAKWYDEHKRKLKYTPTGQVSTDRETLTGVECYCGFAFKEHDENCDVDGPHRGLWAVAETTRLGKTLTTYIPALERGVTVPLNPNFNPIIETFRTSCSQGMRIANENGKKVPVGFNAQNPPRKKGVRECIVARKGSVFAFCDYDTLEMRTLAQVCIELFGYSHIADAIRAGQDLHVAMAADMMGLSYDEAMARYEAGDEEISNARQYCKIANYGFAGGMGARAFVSYAKGYGIEVTLAHAKVLHKAFRNKWKEMVDYFKYCSSLCGTGRYAKTVVFPKSKLMRGRVKYTAVCNGFFQHRAAMGAKAALAQVSYECYVDLGTPLYGCRPWLFAHDEIGMEIPYTGRRASEAALRLEQVMEEEMSKWCPDVEISATTAMSYRWRKGTKPVYADENGNPRAKKDGGFLVPAKPVKNKETKKTDWVQDFALAA